MSMMALVNDLENQGRNGDTILAHISREEAELLKDRGGSGTINPDTGIMEFNIFEDLWDGFKDAVRTVAPILIPAVAIFVPTLIPAIGTALGASAATAGVIGAAALSAGVTLAAGGSLKDVLTSAALAGTATYLTPILGKALTPTGASQLGQIMAGSAAFGAGYTALRGGTVKEMIAAASTGAASAYLGNLAKDSVAKMNNMLSTGKATGITEKGATDATFLAADAANLKAAGLTESEISKVLQSTGVNAGSADYAAANITKGMDPSTLAANLAAGSTKGIYTGEANTKAIIAGNNVEQLQRVEDAKLVAQDAAQLKQQGLSAADIKQNLIASGVDATTAGTVATQAFNGDSADRISQNLISSTNYLSSGKVYTNTTDTIARDLGVAMTADQIKEYKALPFKDMVNSGQLTIDEASVLGQHNLTPQQVTDLTKLGYTANDLDNLIGAGVTPQTLTSLANTKFPESQINDLLLNGVTANDIANASTAVNTGKISTDTADTLLRNGLDGREVLTFTNNNQANQIANLIDNGLSESNLRTMVKDYADFNKINTALTDGKLNINDLNNNVATNSNYKQWITSQLAPVPVQPTTTPTTTPTVTLTPTQQIANTGLVNATDASILAQNGYTSNDVTNLINSGYTSDELVNLASTGVRANTLTTLANTQFDETDINNLLTKGTSANDIATASTLINQGKLTTDTAIKLMDNKVGQYDLTSLANANKADAAAQLLDKGVSKSNIMFMSGQNADLSKINAALDYGVMSAKDFNNSFSTTAWNQTVKTLSSFTPPVAPTVTQPTTPAPVDYVSDLAKSIAQGTYANPSVVQQFLDMGYSVQQISNAISENPLSGLEGAHNYGDALLAQTPGLQPVQPNPTATAAYTPEQEQLYKQYISQGMSPAQATQLIENETVTDTTPISVNVSGSPVYSDSPGSGLKGPIPEGYELAPSTDLSGAEYRSDINAYVRPIQPTVPETPYIPVVTPTIPTTTNVTPNIPTPTPPQVPIQPEQPTTPTVVSSSTRTTMDGSVYKDDQNSDGTVTSTLISGPIGTGGTGGGTTGTTQTTPQVPLTPPTQVTVPPGSSYVAPVETTPDNTIPSNVDPGGSYDADIPETPVTPPFIPIPPVTPPTTPTDTTHYGTFTIGEKPTINIPQGLNPGWITNVPQFYQTTNPAQSQYYWGAHPFQPGPTFNPTLYNQVPNAPQQPFGLGYAQTSASAQDVLNAMQGRYPLLGQTTAAPVRPT